MSRYSEQQSTEEPNLNKGAPLSSFAPPEEYAPKSKEDFKEGFKFNVLIVGHGYVGSAVASILNDDEKTIVDPRYNDNKISDFKDQKFDAVFVCVDTPEGDKFKLLNSVLVDLDENMLPDTPVCCKSTASPQFYSEAAEACNNIKVVFCPEYLNKFDPVQMFQRQKFCILGGDIEASHKIYTILFDRLHHCPADNYRFMDIRSAALHKYAVNFMLSYRVTFFNELYLQHKFQGCDTIWEHFVDAVCMDPRVGTAHNKVPGEDQKFGWSSHCLDKDAAAFEEFSGSPLVKFIRELNDLHREYNGGPSKPAQMELMKGNAEKTVSDFIEEQNKNVIDESK
jgi:hypothetical protein